MAKSIYNPVGSVASGIMTTINPGLKKRSGSKPGDDEAAQAMGTFKGDTGIINQDRLKAPAAKSVSMVPMKKAQSPIERRLAAQTPALAPTARVREEFNARVDPRFATLRERATAASNSATQGDVEAIRRRFAAQGALNSGEAMKIEQQAREKGAELANLAQQDINNAEIGDIAQQRAAFDERQFAREQTDVANQFASAEAQKAMKFQQKMAEKELGFKQKMASQDAKQFKANLKIAKEQLKLDKMVTAFNMGMAKDQANQKGFLDKLISGGGKIGDYFKNQVSPGGVLKNVAMGPSSFLPSGGGGGGGVTGLGI